MHPVPKVEKEGCPLERPDMLWEDGHENVFFCFYPCRSPRIPDSQAVSLSAARLGMVCERRGNPVTCRIMSSGLFAQ